MSGQVVSVSVVSPASSWRIRWASFRRFSPLFMLVVVISNFESGFASDLPERDFPSLSAAFDAFSKAGDPITRQSAYTWMTNRLAGPSNFSEVSFVCVCAGKAARALGEDASFDDFCRKIIADSSSAEEEYSYVSAYSDWLLAGDDGVNRALSVLVDSLDNSKLISEKTRASIALKASGLITSRKFDYLSADELLSSQISLVSTNSLEAYSSLLVASASARRAAGDFSGALERVKEVTAFGDDVPSSFFSQACDIEYLIALDAGQEHDAAQALLTLLRHKGLPPAGISRKIIDADSSPDVLSQGVALLRSKIPGAVSRTADFQQFVERIEPEIIEFLLASGSFEEALAECRVFALTASARAYGSAIDFAARSFKAMDGNLSRASQLLAFHEEGSELENPLMDIPAAADEQRNAILGTLQPLPPAASYSSHLERARLLLWLDRPYEAVLSAAKAFSLCPMREESLRLCAQATSYPVLVLLRDKTLADCMISWLLYGHAGADGEPGTPDDLSDPFAEAGSRLAYKGTDAPHEAAGEEGEAVQ